MNIPRAEGEVLKEGLTAAVCVCLCVLRGSGLCFRQCLVRICRGVTSHLCGLAWTYKPEEQS